jgi:hypothetical protein
MDHLVLDGLYLTPNQRRLLGGWRDILDDIRRLCTSLKALPDGCACGNGRSHLGGSCACCHAVHCERIPDCADCETVLAQLRPEFDTLAVDTIRFLPVVTMLLDAPQLEPAQTEGPGIERHIAAVVRTFDRLVVAVDEFQIGYRASHLQALKGAATDRLAEV